MILRISMGVLLLAGLGCCALGGILGVAPLLMDVRLQNGTVAPPGLGIIAGLCIAVPGVLMMVGCGLLWWTLRPALSMRAQYEDRVGQLRAVAVQGYLDWVTSIRVRQPMGDEPVPLLETLRARTLALLPLLDGPGKRLVLQFVYDVGLITSPAVLQLGGADLRGVDLTGISLHSADLRGVDLRGSRLDHANLSGANLQDALITREQLASVAVISAATLPDGTIVGT